MSLAADALQPFLISGLIALEGRPSGVTLADLIGKQKKIGFDLDFDDQAESILADFRDPVPVLDSIAFDISRFSSASFQSIKSIPDEIVNSEQISWSIIKAYYAAFYAGHSIIRLFGKSCSYLDRTYMSRISSLATASGKIPGFKLQASAYHCILDQSGACITSTSLRRGIGGAHEAFWNIFGLLMRQIANDILRGPLSEFESQGVFSKIDGLQQSISSRGSPLFSWLSVVRNDVQYRHEYGVWLPCRLKKHDRERLGRLIGQWQRDPMEIDVGVPVGDTLGEFAVTCAFIVALCHSLLIRIVERTERRGRSFAKLGPLAVLRG